MRRITKYWAFTFLVLLLLTGCHSNNTMENIFQYKDSYVGDNSAVGNIAQQLHNSEYLDGFELKTTKEPYGIILNYHLNHSEEVYKETVIRNSTYLFALVQNVDWITFRFNKLEYKITKDKLQSWYGKEISSISSEEELEKLIEKLLKDDKKMNEL